ncbi:MAG TPA: sortase [Candidatus Absconditabacterales bacterium]|nr:sortase [Candidatus Absconditabacterales bacterium]
MFTLPIEKLESPLYSPLHSSQKKKKKNSFRFHNAVKEFFTLSGIVLLVGFLSIVFINIEVVAMNISDFLFGFQTEHGITSTLFSFKHEKPQLQPDEKFLEKEIINDTGTILSGVMAPIALNYETQLKKNTQLTRFDFNLLPPENRIIIPSIDIDAPVVDLQYAAMENFEAGNYDTELYSGTVKYPTTPDPGSSGNSLIFGHTSFYWRKHNPYGTIFARLPKLKKSDQIQVIWNGKLHTYRVKEKIIVSPDKVKQTYLSYKNGNFLTLMGCYPVGSDKDRILIIAELVTPKQSLAYSSN